MITGDEAFLRDDRYCSVHDIDLVPPDRTLRTRRYCPECPPGSSLGWPNDSGSTLTGSRTATSARGTPRSIYGRSATCAAPGTCPATTTGAGPRGS